MLENCYNILNMVYYYFYVLTEYLNYSNSFNIDKYYFKLVKLIVIFI